MDNEYIVVTASFPVVDWPCAMNILSFSLGTIIEMMKLLRGFPMDL